jgi:O-antigen ligase
LLNSAISVAQFVHPRTVSIVDSLYASGRHAELNALQRRAYGVFANPNTNATMLVLLALPSYFLFRTSRQVRYALAGFLVAGSVITTGSRSGLLQLAVATFLLAIFSGRVKIIACMMAVMGIGYCLLIQGVETGAIREHLPYLGQFSEKIYDFVNGSDLDLSSMSTIRARFSIWDNALADFESNPFFGVGPDRDFSESYCDNYYIYQLAHYGLAGLAGFLVLALCSIAIAALTFLRDRSFLRDWCVVVICAWSVVLVANITIDAYLLIQIASVVLLLTGHLTASADSRSVLCGAPTVSRPTIQATAPTNASAPMRAAPKNG